MPARNLPPSKPKFHEAHEERCSIPQVAHKVQVFVGDARATGNLGDVASFDAIHVGACVPASLITTLASRLSSGGRLVFTEGRNEASFGGVVMGPQELKVIDRDAEGRLGKAVGVGLSLRMVPLASMEEQENRTSKRSLSHK